jgi:uncharacterized membrane protein YgdD (TMEM256/DUF423 family)
MHKKIFVLAAILGLLAVALGAFGAHLLKKHLEAEDLAVYNTGIQYHFYHALAIICVGFLYKQYHHKTLIWSARFFLIGIILFSGSLYIMQFIKAAGAPSVKWLGAITPIGGMALMLGWGFIAMYFLFDKKRPQNPA